MKLWNQFQHQFAPIVICICYVWFLRFFSVGKTEVESDHFDHFAFEATVPPLNAKSLKCFLGKL